MQISHSFVVPKVDIARSEEIQNKIDNKTKPPGSLGQLEKLAKQIALIQCDDKITLNRPTMLVFAADHGIAEEGVSIAPSEVTGQMVQNFIHGGAAINCFCDTNGIGLKVIDAGILNPVDDHRVVPNSLGPGTKNFSREPAMTVADAEKAIELGAQIAEDVADMGCNVMGFGEMGIGNTSSAAAIMVALTDLPVEKCVGRGTGIDEQALTKKRDLVTQAIQLHKELLTSPINILAALGGFEIAQITGAMLAAAQSRCILLVDGFIATSAALLASKICPEAKDYMVFCHQSEEQGHRLMLEYLEAEPLLSLGLRLGEGTGAALGYSIIQATATFFNDMASFEDAGVSAV